MSLAFVFPGQGSQAVAMLDSFASDASLQQLLKTADDALAEPLSELIAKGPAETLAQTVNTQPAMLLAGYVCFSAWRAAGGPEPVAVAGHSLGEYTALTAAGSLSLADAIKLVRTRAQAMQSAVPLGTGGMAAILGLDDDAVRKACSDAAALQPGWVVEAVNFNAPAQVVIAGHHAAVAQACSNAKAAGAKRALALAVSAPFHCSLLRPAGDQLQQDLRRYDLKSPRYPLVNNVDAKVQTEPSLIKDALVRQSYSAVRWVEVVQQLSKLGVTHFIEFGPGKVLTGLVPRIDKSLRASAVYDANSLQTVLAAVRNEATGAKA